MNLRALWRQTRRDQLVELRRQLDTANALGDFLRDARADARAKQLAAEAAATRHAAQLRAVADVLADQSLSTAAANQRVRQILMEDGPVSGGGSE